MTLFCQKPTPLTRTSEQMNLCHHSPLYVKVRKVSTKKDQNTKWTFFFSFLITFFQEHLSLF